MSGLPKAPWALWGPRAPNKGRPLVLAGPWAPKRRPEALGAFLEIRDFGQVGDHPPFVLRVLPEIRPVGVKLL